MKQHHIHLLREVIPFTSWCCANVCEPVGLSIHKLELGVTISGKYVWQALCYLQRRNLGLILTTQICGSVTRLEEIRFLKTLE